MMAVAYDDAFRSLVHVLTAVTILAGLSAFGFLGRTLKVKTAAGLAVAAA